MSLHDPYEPPEYDEYWEVGSRTKHTARKEHKCDFCWAPIKPGQEYWRQAYKGIDGFYVSRSHVRDCEVPV